MILASDVTKINESLQGSSVSMTATKKGKFCIKVHKVGSTEWVYVLWPIKYCAKAGANLYSLTCKLLQRNKIKNDPKDNIMVHSSECNIILDHCIKTHNSWVARAEFLQDTGQERTQLANAFIRKDIIDLYDKLGNTSKVITHTTAKSMVIHLTVTFKPCEDCTL